MIAAAIYDMDGLIVDSEPWWRVAESNVFGRLSRSPSEADFEMMMGRQIKEVIHHWYSIAPWENFSLEETQKEILSEVARLVKENAQLLPGVIESLQFFKKKDLALALASSSPLHLIRDLMQHYGLLNHFKVICSAEFESHGKPHPAVFIKAAQELGIDPQHCLVLEDSFNGLISAKAARMKCIAVPEKKSFHQTRFDIADLKLSSLAEFSEKDWEILNK
jgi:HAD superfamily hydrolase (TIGR01509 family)